MTDISKRREALDSVIIQHGIASMPVEKFNAICATLTAATERAEKAEATRELLMQTGRALGCFLADEVSLDFLGNIPEEARLLRARVAALEGALDDTNAHLRDFREACCIARDHAKVSPPDRDDKAYWEHQIGVLDRISAVLSAAPDAREATPPDTNAYPAHIFPGHVAAPSQAAADGSFESAIGAVRGVVRSLESKHAYDTETLNTLCVNILRANPTLDDLSSYLKTRWPQNAPIDRAAEQDERGGLRG